MAGRSTSSSAATTVAAAAPRSAAALHLCGLLLLLSSLLPLGAQAQDTDVRGAVSRSYAAWQSGEHAAARDLAREAIALDDGIASLVARRVLVLALEALGEPAEALQELDQYLAFELTPKDRQWAEERAVALKASLPAPSTADPPPEPAPDPPSEPASDPVDDAAPGGADPDRTAPVLVAAVGGGFQQLGSWSYGAVDVDGSLRLVGALRLRIGWQLGLVGGQPCSAGEPDGCVSALNTVAIGPRARIPGPVSPLLDAGLLVGLNGGDSPYAPVMLGLDVGGGVAFVPGPIGARLRGAFRLLSAPIGEAGPPRPGAMVTFDLEVRVGR